MLVEVYLHRRCAAEFLAFQGSALQRHLHSVRTTCILQHVAAHYCGFQQPPAAHSSTCVHLSPQAPAHPLDTCTGLKIVLPKTLSPTRITTSRATYRGHDTKAEMFGDACIDIYTRTGNRRSALGFVFVQRRLSDKVASQTTHANLCALHINFQKMDYSEIVFLEQAAQGSARYVVLLCT